MQKISDICINIQKISDICEALHIYVTHHILHLKKYRSRCPFDVWPKIAIATKYHHEPSNQNASISIHFNVIINCSIFYDCYNPLLSCPSADSGAWLQHNAHRACVRRGGGGGVCVEFHNIFLLCLLFWTYKCHNNFP